MSKNKQKAKFFCENCNNEVPADAKFCNKCGKFFYSVRCPMCGKTGNQNLFLNGCPQCGYAVGSSSDYYNSLSKSDKNNSTRHMDYAGNSNKKKKTGEDPLPVWVYLLCGLTLLSIIVVMLRFYIF